MTEWKLPTPWKPPTFEGVLAKPILGTGGDKPWPDQIAERWAALFARYGLDPAAPDLWQQLSRALVDECVPGFQALLQPIKVGRRQEWGFSELALFWIEVEAIKREKPRPTSKRETADFNTTAIKTYVERRAKAGTPAKQGHRALGNRMAKAKQIVDEIIADQIKSGIRADREEALAWLIERYATLHKKAAT